MINFRELAKFTARPLALAERRLVERRGGKGLTLPTFLSIGAPQSGTTWLYQNLILHPDISIPIKEVRFFDALHHRPLLWYSSLYSAEQSDIRGDMSTSYMRLAPRQIEFISRIMPNVSVIIIVRNPVERAWSGYRRWRGRNPKPNCSDVEDYLRWSVEGFRSWASSPIEYSCYSEALEHWLRFFPLERFLVLSFEDMSSNPMSFLTEVLDHIGASVRRFPWARMSTAKVNRNPHLDMPDDIRIMLQRRYAGEHERLRCMFRLHERVLWNQR